MLHDKTVMWLRRGADRVWLLTVGDAAYMSDPRLSVRFQYPNNWRLHISPVRRSDEGVYECQVSTHPPRTLTTNLTVLAPELKIVDEHGHAVHDRYYKTGSTVELACRVAGPSGTPLPAPAAPAPPNAAPKGAPRPQRHITWRKDGRPLPKKARATELSQTPGEFPISHLVVAHADKSDSGTYSCSVSKDSEVSVHVHVLNGEHQAAVHHDTWSSNDSQSLNHTLSWGLWFLLKLMLQFSEYKFSV